MKISSFLPGAKLNFVPALEDMNSGYGDPVRSLPPPWFFSDKAGEPFYTKTSTTYCGFFPWFLFVFSYIYHSFSLCCDTDRAAVFFFFLPGSRRSCGKEEGEG